MNKCTVCSFIDNSGIPQEMTFDKTKNQFKINQAVTISKIMDSEFKISDEMKSKIDTELGDIPLRAKQ